MLYFANPSTESVRDAMRAGQLGSIHTPRQGNRRIPGVTWCADNGCYGKGYPGDAAWLGWLASCAGDVGSCSFATAPDVVGDAVATLKRSKPWLSAMRALGYRASLVAQDGLHPYMVPWGSFDVLFIGGSTEWKLGPECRTLIAQAKRLDKGVHFGRVNSLRRYRYAKALGCDSVDGTYLTFGPDKNLPTLLSWLEESA